MFDPNHLWFTSDTHFGHKGVLKYQDARSHFSSVEEMDEYLISEWNKVITPQDHVFHLGDFALCSTDRVKELARLLNGNMHLVVGNHDAKAASVKKRFSSFRQIAEIAIDDPEGRQEIVCCHYCLRTWNKSHYGAWHLHGHSHGSLPRPAGPVLDVGVDCHNLRPISYWKVKELMRGRAFEPVDHHREEPE